MRPNANIIKTYWQAMDGDGKVYLFYNEKPTCDDGKYYSCYSGEYTAGITFPIPLKPLQIAEIKVCENGTWSYEIEREVGWYMAKATANNRTTKIVKYKNGAFHDYDGNSCATDFYTISSTRIPDECII